MEISVDLTRTVTSEPAARPSSPTAALVIAEVIVSPPSITIFTTAIAPPWSIAVIVPGIWLRMLRPDTSPTARDTSVALTRIWTCAPLAMPSSRTASVVTAVTTSRPAARRIFTALIASPEVISVTVPESWLRILMLMLDLTEFPACRGRSGAATFARDALVPS